MPCPLGRSDLLSVLPPDQHDFIPDVHRCVANVDKDLVHGDRACESMSSASDQHFALAGKGSWQAVGIPDRDGRYRCFLGEWPPSPVGLSLIHISEPTRPY